MASVPTRNDRADLIPDRDRLLREAFALGFVILLALVAGMGILAYRRVGAVEEAITDRTVANQLNLGIVLRLHEQTSLLSAEGKTFLTAQSLGSKTGPVEHRIREIENDLGETIAAGRERELGNTPEWSEFEASLAEYSAGIGRPEPTTDAVNARFDNAKHALLDRVQRDTRETELLGMTMRHQAQRDIAITTAICLGLGVLISALSFELTRRRIGQMRRANARIARSVALVEGTLESMGSAVVSVDQYGVVTRINGLALRAFQLERSSDCVGRPFRECLRGHALVGLLEPLSRGEPVVEGYFGRYEFGADRRLYDVGVAPLVIGQELSGYIITLTDVTDAERANEELRRNRSLASVGQVIAQVAHEIRNPLGGMKLATQVLARRLAGDEQSEQVIKRIENSVDHLTQIVGELNQFARPNSVSLEPVDVVAVLEELLAMISDKTAIKSISIEKVLDVETGEVMLDGKEIRKAFINILINAIEASPEGGRVEVRLLSSSIPYETLQFVVRDHGPGMDEETRRRLFEPFFTTKQAGTGLGMVITKNIVELHGGTIAVDSVEGEGTTVTITMPLRAAPAEAARGVREGS